MYNEFYFLHLDKTVGKLFSVHTMNPLYEIMEQNNINAFEKNATHDRHNYWQDFNDSTYVFCAIREPVQRLISIFCYEMIYNEYGVRKWNGWRDWMCPDINLDNFKYWIEKSNTNNYQHNILTKNGTIDINYSLSRINLLIKTDQILNNELAIQNKILSDLGINKTRDIFNREFEQEFHDEPGKNFLRDHLIGTDYHKQLVEMNRLDYEIYNSSKVLGL